MDKQASPLTSQTSPSTSDSNTSMSAVIEPMSDSEDSQSTSTSTSESSLPQVEPEQQVNTCSTDQPGANVQHQGTSPPTFTPHDNNNNDPVASEGVPSSSQGGSNNLGPTLIINEDQLYDLLQPNDDTENSTITSPEQSETTTTPEISQAHQTFTSIFPNQLQPT